jgi:hypothetical protein
MSDEIVGMLVGGGLALAGLIVGGFISLFTMNFVTRLNRRDDR